MLYQYKSINKGKVTHGYRMQNIEDNFASGMQYTNTPLLEGFNKVLVNYDIYDSGASLKPRQGLRAYRGFMNTSKVSTYDEATAIKLDFTHHYADIDKDLFIYHDTAPETDTGLVELDCMTGNPTLPESDADTMTPFNLFTDNNISVANGTNCITDGATDEFDKAYVTYYKPKDAAIHGITVENTGNMLRAAGCLGFNENYYALGKTAASAGIPCIWHTELNAKGYVWKKDLPKELTAKEAVTYGYNMLSTTPYSFVNSEAPVDGKLDFYGMLPYDSGGNLCMTPIMNQTYTFKVYAQVPSKSYHFVVKWRTATDTVWETLKDWTADVTYQSDISFEFSPPYEGVIIQITATGYTNNVENDLNEATLAVGFSFKKEDYGSTANISNKVYTIADSKGICYWRNRLVAWGAPEDEKLLFISDVNDPTYFPYPNNVDTFDSAIRYCQAFQDYLLVFTANALYSLTLAVDGLSWTTKCIQKNLYIDDWDTHIIQVVKNMVFFKSGNYYYMVVPKASSTTGELTIAAISKPMVYFFDKFETNVRELLNELYNTDIDMPLELVHYYNYLDYEDVHCIYVLKKYTKSGSTWNLTNEYINLALLYNTVTRSWRVYTYGSPAIYIPYLSNATQKGALCTCVCNKVSAEATTFYPYVYLLHYDSISCQDFYISNGDITNNNFDTDNIIKNYQLLDTGYREHTSNFKKRYRELQFTLNNTSQIDLNFYTDFYIDGAPRKQTAKYDVVVNEDSDSPDYGLLSVERSLVDPECVPGTTRLNQWKLDHSMFPGVPMWKVRFPVSGKGYVPRMVIKCMTQASYELLNLSWVYRALYSR